jgi:ATP-dependent RNA helicase RhlE
VAPLHGDRSQSQRERALRDFKRGRVSILVATDIASRGIDVDGITHVVNFDVPRTSEDYVHRIGRTGRMNATGDALTLVSPAEEKDAAAIERTIGRRIQRVKIADFDYNKRGEKQPRERETRSREPRGGDRPTFKVTRAYDSHAGTRSQSAVAYAGAGGGGTTNGSGTNGSGTNGTSEELAHGRQRRRNTTDRRNRKRM